MSQTKKFEDVLEYCRLLYNAALQERISFYKKFGKGISYADQCKSLTLVRESFPEYKDIHSQILQAILKRLQRAFENFFRRVKNGEENPGFPRYQSYGRYDSFMYPQSGFHIHGNRLFLSKIGHIKIIQHQPIIGKIKTCTIKRDKTGKYFAYFSVELPDDIQLTNKTGKEIGIDLGISQYITTSDNDIIENPKIFDKHAKRIAKANRKFASKPRGSKQITRARLHLARCYQKRTNSREDFQHKLSRNLVNNYDKIYLENLDVKDMISKENHKSLNRNIASCSWAKLTDMIVYKAEEAGKQIIFVDPAYTTQTCSNCGNIVMKKLSERKHKCKKCGYQTSRDHNAAINILNRGRGENPFLGRLGMDSPVNEPRSSHF